MEKVYSEWIPWMQRALRLAELGDGLTSPNPIVGAVVLDSQRNLVGEGFHCRAGMPHAEVNALSQARESSIGGTLLVTLEPCCHHGRTPPCTDLILRSKIRKVIVGMRDPDPRVAGKGIDILRANGIEVITGVLEDEVAFQNRAFVFRVRNGRPWGTLKWAMSCDGRIALPNGISQWISSKPARGYVHSLRAKCDAVIIGGGTVRCDNPLLTTRGISDPEPLRVVLSKSLNLPKDSQLWDVTKARTILAYEDISRDEQTIDIPKGPERVKLKNADPIHLLNKLTKFGCNRVLWECGAHLATEAIRQDCVQEIVMVLAPKILGGDQAMTPFGDLGFRSMSEVLLTDQFSIRKKGQDLIFHSLL